MLPKTGLLIPNMGMCRISTIILIFSTVVAGCATPYQHWLTDEEDEAFRAQCEGKGCVIVPGHLWEQIKAALAKALGVEI